MGQEYRYAVFLTEADWRSAVSGYGKRVRRFRAAARVEQAERVRLAMQGAEADSFPDGDDFRYVIFLCERDYAFLCEAVTNRRNGIPRDVAQRIKGELLMADGEKREA